MKQTARTEPAAIRWVDEGELKDSRIRSCAPQQFIPTRARTGVCSAALGLAPPTLTRTSHQSAPMHAHASPSLTRPTPA